MINRKEMLDELLSMNNESADKAVEYIHKLEALCFLLASGDKLLTYSEHKNEYDISALKAEYACVDNLIVNKIAMKKE